MPTLETPPNPATPPTPPPETQKIRTGRFGELEEHELIHLIDALDDERSKARFRESVYISIFVYIFIAWFVLYVPRWLPMPKIVTPPIEKSHQQEMSNLTVPKDLQRELARQAPKPVPKPTPQPQQAVATPQPPTPPPAATQPQPQPNQARPTPPPVQPPPPNAPSTIQPPHTPPAPQPQAMVDAPKPSFNRPPQSAGEAIRQAARDAARGQQGGGATTAPSYQGGGRSPLGSGAEILTDTQGVDFSHWMNRFHDDVMRNWEPLIPESVRPPISKRGILGIRITVLQGGKIANMILETRSGDVALDHAAWSALLAEGLYPPLPKEFPGPSIEIRCTFVYNEQR